MKKIEFLYHGQLTTFRIEKSFPNDKKFRILIDREGRPTSAVIGTDGENEREFETYSEAEKHLLKYANNCIRTGMIKSFTVF